MTSRTPEQRRRFYLARVFALNPLFQTAQVLDARRTALGLTRYDAADTPPRQDQRQASAEVRDRVKRVQEHFWTLPLDQLKAHLNALWALGLPEFVPVLKRLATVASCRPAFPQLAQEKRMDLPLFHAFKTAVVLSPAEAGYAKEEFLYSLRLVPARLKQVQKAVALIHDNYPPLFELEKDWFATILRLKKRRLSQAAQGGDSAAVGSLQIGMGILAVVGVILRVIFAILRDVR